MSNAYEILSRYDPELPRKRAGRLLTDTTEFMNIGYGDVIELDGTYFLVLRDEKERSFGVEDPKYWVKRCKSLGDRKILKLVFFETIPRVIELMEIECFPQPARGGPRTAIWVGATAASCRAIPGMTCPETTSGSLMSSQGAPTSWH